MGPCVLPYLFPFFFPPYAFSRDSGFEIRRLPSLPSPLPLSSLHHATTTQHKSHAPPMHLFPMHSYSYSFHLRSGPSPSSLYAAPPQKKKSTSIMAQITSRVPCPVSCIPCSCPVSVSTTRRNHPDLDSVCDPGILDILYTGCGMRDRLGVGLEARQARYLNT